MTHLYTLDGKTPVPTDDVHEWAKWFENNHPVYVNKTVIDDVTVSTVFLGIDNGWALDGEPELFETMVFGGYADGLMVRYANWDEAVGGHRQLCKSAFE